MLPTATGELGGAEQLDRHVAAGWVMNAATLDEPETELPLTEVSFVAMPVARY